jgi:uncharacterized protein
MWIRRCEIDAQLEAPLPLPTQIASNEEFIPPPQSPQQREVEARTLEIADREARRHGVSRREFLRSAGGMAAAFMAMNQVFGPCYEVDAAEVEDPAARREKWPKDLFIFDVQTHHVDTDQKWFDNTEEGRRVKQFLRLLRPGMPAGSIDQLNRDHYVKEVFFDSDTVMAVISGVPTREWDRNILPPDQMVATRNYVNGLSGSQRVLSHGLLRPNLGAGEMEEMDRQVKVLKIDAWKMYTGAELGEQAWWMDDEKVAYPFWEKTEKFGIRNVCVHKGLPLGMFNEEHCKPRDVVKAAKDFPRLNFLIYHSGFAGFGARGLRLMAGGNPQEIPWISDLLRDLKANPAVKNVYFELGSTFNQTSMYAPEVCMHMLGQMLQVGGEDRILWGTDSIWGGSPQSQIERLRRLTIKDELIEKYGYPQLTPAVKEKILGLNAAKLFGIDPRASRKALERDRMSRLREEYAQNPTPSNTQYGWVWQEEPGRAPEPPVGA